MKLRLALIVCLPVYALAYVGVAASEGGALKNNPFARPPSEVTLDARSRRGLEGTPAPLELRATLVSGSLRLANVAGNIFKPGDEVNGHLLVSVHEDKAIFLRNGIEISVYVKPDLVSENETKQQ